MKHTTKKQRNTAVRFNSVCGVLIFGFVLFLVSFFATVYSTPVYAGTFTADMYERATHPNATLMSSDDGKKIGSLRLFENKLYSGYGDYNANTGPIVINPFNPSTNTFEGPALSVPTEAIGGWRVLNGKLYSTTIDPTCGALCPAGYVEYDQATGWQLKTPINALHVFDVASLGPDDLWLFGSDNTGAAMWHTADGGEVWQRVRTRGEDRYYWGLAFNGSMHAQASSINVFLGPLESFNGSTWQETPLNPSFCGFGNVQGGPDPVVFKGKMYCREGYTLSSYDGSNISVVNSSNFQSNGCNTQGLKYMASDEFLYVLCPDTSYNDSVNSALLTRTRDLESWDRIQGLPERATSFEVDEVSGALYVGTADSKIYSSTLPPEDTVAPQVAITAPTQGARFSLTDEISVVAQVTDDNNVRDVVFQLDGETFRTRTAPPYSAAIINYYTSSTGQWRVSPGQHTLQVIATDDSGNQTTKTVAIQVDAPTEQVRTKVLNAVTPSGDPSNNEIILSVGQDASISCSDTSTEKSFGTYDRKLDYPYGFVSFCLDVPTGSTQTVDLWFETSAKAKQASVRKYNRITSQYGAIPNVTIQEAARNGKQYLRVSYQITDGGALDEDGVANGTIVDPIGLGFNPFTAAFLTVQSRSVNGSRLAKTGLGVGVIVSVAVTVSGLSVYLLFRLKKNDSFRLSA